MEKPLRGQKILVLVENKFIPEEIAAYQSVFPSLGGEVVLASRIWYGEYRPKQTIFYSDVDPLDNQPWESPHTLAVSQDISTVSLEEYAAIIMSANYTSVRLRWEDLPSPDRFDVRHYVTTPPVVQLFARAMQCRWLVKGALCHGLWVLTPHPELLEGRTVTCHAVVMADVANTGARVVLSPTGVITDDDLVTGFSKHEVGAFIEAIAEAVARRGATSRSQPLQIEETRVSAAGAERGA